MKYFTSYYCTHIGNMFNAHSSEKKTERNEYFNIGGREISPKQAFFGKPLLMKKVICPRFDALLHLMHLMHLINLMQKYTYCLYC